MKIKHLFLALAASAFVLAGCNEKPSPRPDPTPKPDPSEETVHAGTLEDPFTVSDAIIKCKAIGQTDPTEADPIYYVKGIVKSVDESGIAQYGNITCELTDPDGTDKFTAFQICYFNKKKFTSPCPVTVGDEIVVAGRIYNYKGNTPETQGKGNAWVVSHNGQGETPEVPGAPKGTGTENDPFNVAAAIAKCQETGTTATTDVYYVEGTVETVNSNNVETYGNITLDLIDEGCTPVFTAYQVFPIQEGGKFTTGKEVKAGDKVLVKGCLVNYSNNTPETSKGTGYVVKVNGAAPVLTSAINIAATTNVNWDELTTAVALTIVNPTEGVTATVTSLTEGLTVSLGKDAVMVTLASENTTDANKEYQFKVSYPGIADVTATIVQKTKPSGDEVVLNFAENNWNLPEASAKKTAEEKQYSNGTYTITLVGGGSSNGYYYNTDGYLILGKQGASLTLPAFDFAVKSIKIEGRNGASTSVKQNIYVGDTAVSTETTGAAETNTYEIDAAHQAAGTIYTLKVNSNHNTQIVTITIIG